MTTSGVQERRSLLELRASQNGLCEVEVRRELSAAKNLIEEVKTVVTCRVILHMAQIVSIGKSVGTP